MNTIYNANMLTSVCIYVHERDNPLGLSQEIHYNIQRVGQLCGAKQLLDVLNPESNKRKVPPYQYLHIINATSCEERRFCGIYVNLLNNVRFRLNHSYWNYSQFQNSLNNVISNKTGSLKHDNVNCI